MKRIRRVLLALVSLAFICFLIVGGLIYSGTQQTPQKNADTMIILGAQVRGNPAVPSAILKERLDVAIPYLLENPQTKVVVTGGQGSDETDTEANVMARYLIEKGIDAQRIIKESQSSRTEENIANAKKLTDLGKTVIVTSDFHMYRGLMLARRENVDASGLPAVSKSSATFKSYAREMLALPYGLLVDW